jgi:hypothetical protein
MAPMIWSFTRGSAQVDIEVRRVGEPAVFELVIDYPDGSEEVRRFTQPRKLVRRTLNVQRRLIRQGWVPGGAGVRQLTAGPQRARSRFAGPRRLWARLQKHVSERLAATFGF